MDEQVRRTEIAVVLRDLVLEDQVVAPRVPGELAGQPVVLVQVGALMGEDHVGRELGLQALEERLDGVAAVRKEPVAETAEDDPRRPKPAVKSAALRRASSPRSPSPLSTTHDDLGLGIGLRQPQDRAAAADLDVVGVGADREHAQMPSIEARSDAVRASGRDRAGSTATPPPLRSQRAHGACPLSSSPSRCCFSFSVSIGAQKPSYGYAISFCSAISRWNGSSTRSSPSRM